MDLSLKHNLDTPKKNSLVFKLFKKGILNISITTKLIDDDIKKVYEIVNVIIGKTTKIYLSIKVGKNIFLALLNFINDSLSKESHFSKFQRIIIKEKLKLLKEIYAYNKSV